MPENTFVPFGRVRGTDNGTEDVTFRNCNRQMFKRLGQLIYDASKKRGDRANFENGVRAMMASNADLAESLGTVKINVIWDTEDTLNIVIPELKDEKDFKDGGFDEYLVQLGVVTLRACKK